MHNKIHFAAAGGCARGLIYFLAGLITLSSSLGADCQNGKCTAPPTTPQPQPPIHHRERGSPQGLSTNSNYSDDTNINQRVQNTMRSVQQGQRSNVSASVYNGSVTLSGIVGSEHEKSKIENRIRSIPGVQNVNNQLTVGKLNPN